MRILLLAVLLASSFGQAQEILNGSVGGPSNQNYIITVRVAELPAIVPPLQLADQRHFVGGRFVRDGADSTDCSTGGGTTVVFCLSNGTSWTGWPLGGSGGGGTGNVSNSGTPNAGQLSLWTNSTHIQGVDLLPLGNLPTSGVTAGTYGDATHVPALVIDAKGRITGASVNVLGAAAALAISTVIATPGVDTKVATEKAVRDLFNTVGPGTSFTIGPNNTLTFVAGVLDTNNTTVARSDQTSDILADWIYHIGQTWVEQATCDTPSAGSLVLCASTSDHAPHYKTSDGILHNFGGSSAATQLVDSGGLPTIKSLATASAVNWLTAKGSAGTGEVILSADGAATDISVAIDYKGAAGFSFGHVNTVTSNAIQVIDHAAMFAGMYFDIADPLNVRIGGGSGATVFQIDPATHVTHIELVQLNSTTAGTCAAGLRGQFQYTASGAGVKDIVEVCAKDAADSYAWRTIY